MPCGDSSKIVRGPSETREQDDYDYGPLVEQVFSNPTKKECLALIGIEEENPSWVAIKLAYSLRAGQLENLPNGGGFRLKALDAAFDFLYRAYH